MKNPFTPKGEILKPRRSSLLLSPKMIKKFCKLSDDELKQLNINPKEIRELNKHYNS